MSGHLTLIWRHEKPRYLRMTIKRITANLPEKLLEEACKTTGDGITETLIAGLELVARKSAVENLKKLKGKIQLHEDKGRRHGRNGNG
jgi:hypothetical protein